MSDAPPGSRPLAGCERACRIEGWSYGTAAAACAALAFAVGAPSAWPLAGLFAGLVLYHAVVVRPWVRRGSSPNGLSHATSVLVAASSCAAATVTGIWPLAAIPAIHNLAAMFEESLSVSVGALGAGLVAGAASYGAIRPGGGEALLVAGILAFSGAIGIVGAVRIRSQSSRIASATRERLALSEAMGRFTTDYLTRKVLDEGFAQGGERADVTVLFVDLRDFTALSERRRPDEVVTLLNEYLAAMVKAVTDHRGHVNKFIGDAVMAVFGAPERNPWHPTDAVRTALAMREAVAVMNRSRRENGGIPIRIGIGVHRGEVIAGLIGSPDRLEWTVVGDTVNVASRVESLNKELGTDLLVTEAVAKEVDPSLGFRKIKAVRLRGKSRPVSVYTTKGAA